MLNNLKEFKLAEIEESVLKFWKEHSIFEQSLKKNQGKPKFVFYEGPPTANGMPGIHHLITRSFKDIVPRFKAMQGFDVPRRAGWDTHGLPVEIQAEKELGFTGKQDIEKYGIAEFNKKCKELVWRYREQFEHATERLGYWLDLKHPYVTYENDYIESLWNIIAQVDKQKLLYQGHKVVPWCTRCGTALSSHELAQGYKEVEDTSVYVKFRLKREGAKKLAQIGQGGSKSAKGAPGMEEYMNTYILSWTTTPWTLPGNLGLAVGEKIKYSVVKVEDELYIIASARLPVVFPDATCYTLHATLTGKDLVGLEYEPLFDVKPLQGKKSYRVWPANFVTTTDGMGVVHTAVMYGEDDYALGVKFGLPQYHTVTEQGHFTKEVKELAGIYAKGGKAEALIIDHLTKSNLLLKSEKYKHDYPFCWRCGTALLYYARTSWFIAMSDLKKQLMANNQKINWIPGHIKDGRFGEWLREVKDWNFSRERYWGTPLPVWKSKDGKRSLVVGALSDFKKYGNISGNRFFGLRHGEASHNGQNKIASGRESETLRSELTEDGIKRAKLAGKQAKKNKIDVIVASPYYRTQQTAKIIAKALGIKIVTDDRLQEINCGIYNWQPVSSYHKFFGSKIERWTHAPEHAETLTDLRRRVVACIRDLNKKYKNKNVLIVSHGDPLWILNSAMLGLEDNNYFNEGFYPDYAKSFEIDPPVLPFDADGRVDLHRPYIDEVVLLDPKTKKELYRTPEVCDVWFDSGSMPWAEDHYPFDISSGKPQKIAYPADYICEAIDQTRGWFYTLLAVATLLKKDAPYKNVICLGHIRDKQGQKMSKSKGNIVEPMEVMNEHGADALRWYFFTANDPGDPKDFDVAELTKINRRFFMILYNSYLFYQSYADTSEQKDAYRSTNILDKWVLSRLHQLIEDVTVKLSIYEIGKAGLAIEKFTDDMSRWYIRRSRDRFQSAARAQGGLNNEEDFAYASATLKETLLTLSKLLAPFTPFFSEALYQALDGSKQSVHLEDWPDSRSGVINQELVHAMDSVRVITATVLALRSGAGIKVRQPLATVFLLDKFLEGKEEVIKILLDEVNVKNVVFDKSMAGDGGVSIDTVLTEELRGEGIIRELSRVIQGLRADAAYRMSDEVSLYISSNDQFVDLVQRYTLQLKRAVGAKEIEFKKFDKIDVQAETKIADQAVWIGVRRA